MWIPLILLGVVSYLIYLIFRPSPNYWEKYGIASYEVGGMLDNLGIVFGKTTPGKTDSILYEKLGSQKLAGFIQMNQPTVLIKDLDIAKQILIKDFDHFVDRRPFTSGQNNHIVDKMVTNLEGEEWKGVRNSMSPAFTTGKIRRMMDHFNGVGQDWVNHFKDEMKKNSKDSIDIDVSEETHRYTVDAIAAAGFGLKPGSVSDKNSPFYKMVGRAVKVDTIRVIKFALAINFPRIIRMLKLSIFDSEAMNFFDGLVTEGLKARMEGKGKMNDFIQLIVESRKGELKGEGNDELSNFEKEAQLSTSEKKNYLMDDSFAKAQAVVFFFAGFLTTANFIGFVMYLLALNKDVQDKLRKELNEKIFKDKEEVDYDVLNNLVYLDMVVNEVLRKYGPASRLERKCVKDYHLKEENLRIPKGSLVVVPIESIHNDKQYYERPDQFYPEHFTPENKANRNPYAFIPFGSGPRNCIGMRFALVESKAAIAHLVHNFIIEPSRKTPIPIKVKCVAFGVQIPDKLELTLRPAK